MDKLCKKILNYLIRASDKPTEELYWFGGDTPAAEAISKAVKYPEPEVDSAIRYLIDLGYLDVQSYCFTLNYRGLKYRHFLREEIFIFWKRSILTPIIVSFATTILTATLWPIAWRWLLDLLKSIQ